MSQFYNQAPAYAPAPAPAPMPAAAAAQGGGFGLILGIVVVLLVVSAVVFFAMKGSFGSSGTSTSAQDIAAQMQTEAAKAVAAATAATAAAAATVPATETLAPLCPENVDPVVDMYGKIYKNICYAQSVGAQFAPTPYTGTGAISDPVTASLLKNIPKALGSRTILGPSAPTAGATVVQGRGGQTIGGVTQGRQQAAPATTAAGGGGGKYYRSQGVAIPTPVYAGQIGRV